METDKVTNFLDWKRQRGLEDNKTLEATGHSEAPLEENNVEKVVEREQRQPLGQQPKVKNPPCSFCTGEYCETLIQEQNVYICNRCVEIATGIFVDDVIPAKRFHPKEATFIWERIQEIVTCTVLEKEKLSRFRDIPSFNIRCSFCHERRTDIVHGYERESIICSRCLAICIELLPVSESREQVSQQSNIRALIRFLREKEREIFIQLVNPGRNL